MSRFRTLQHDNVETNRPPPRPNPTQRTTRLHHDTFFAGLGQCLNYCLNTITNLLIRWSRVRISPDPPYRIRLCGRCPTNPRDTSIINPLVFTTNPYRYRTSCWQFNRTLCDFCLRKKVDSCGSESAAIQRCITPSLNYGLK